VSAGLRARLFASLLLLGLLGALALSLTSADRASAYNNLFRPYGKDPLADPCQKLNVGDDGGLVFRTYDPGKPSIKRFIALLCGPKFTVPPASIFLADDQIWQFELGHHNQSAPQHMFLGGQKSLPWNNGVSTEPYPYVKGPNGSAPAVDAFANLNPAEIAALQEQIEKALQVKFPLEVLECVLGAVESDGVSCLKLLAGPLLDKLVAAAAAVVILFFVDFIKSRQDMANSDWFYWSDGYGFWNFFGDVNPNWIDPSLVVFGQPAFLHFNPAHVRMGVVFSNVGLNQGPDFNLPGKRASSDPQLRRLARLAARMKRGRGRTLIGTNRRDILRGTAGEDKIDGRGGNDLIRGRGGSDPILQGGRGRDRIHGGRGGDNIDGYRGRDRLFGGRGNDQIVDLFGATAVHAGGGSNLVFVRDGKGNDRVHCRTTTDVIDADSGDKLSRKCRKGTVHIDGPRMRIGRGYKSRSGD
jgi:hypothetical protein